MKDRERQQIELIIRQLSDICKRNFVARLDAIYSDHSMKGRLQSGMTIRVAIRAMAEIAENALSELNGRIAAIASDTEAFTFLSAGMHFLLNDLSSNIPGIVKMASGGTDNSAHTAASELFAQIRSNINAELAIAEFQFAEPEALNVPAELAHAEIEPQIHRVMKNPGGKPLAAHWDAMWATLAVSLYTGDLQPKTQADIETVIKQWFLDNDLDVGETAARDRARVLWAKYRAAA